MAITTQSNTHAQQLIDALAKLAEAGVAMPEPKRPLTGGLISQRCPHCGREF